MLTRPSQLSLEKIGPSGGIYAPTLRYHDGTFYMVTTNVTGRGNFLVHTKDPAGEWSEPVWINVPGIDPSLYFEDGKCYLTINPDNTIYLCEINPQTGEILAPRKAIWSGTGGRYPEGPHIYKKDGWYYLMISEGGTEYGHNVTIARSKNIYGPYEANPANPILTHINMNAQYNPIQGVGHADFVQAHDGSWWTVCLGFRPQSGLHHLLGRETFLAPVRWDKNAWPVINGDGTIQLEMDVPTLPLQSVAKADTITWFNKPQLGFEWNYLRNPALGNYQVLEGDSLLRLRATTFTLDDVDTLTFVGRRQEHISFVARTALSLHEAMAGDEAGVTIYRNNQAHYDFYLKQLAKNKQAIVLRYRMGKLTHIEREAELPKGVKTITLQVTGTNNDYQFACSLNNGEYQSIGRIDTRYLSTETNGGFTGTYIGLFAVAKEAQSKAYADFKYFVYKENK